MTQFNTPAAAGGTDVFNSIVTNSIMASSVGASTLNITGTVIEGDSITGSMVYGSAFSCPSIAGSVITGTQATIKAVIGSTVTGSRFTTIGATTFNGLYQVVAGTTAAAGGTTFVAHALGAVPSDVQLTCVGTAGAPYLVSATSGTIGFGSNVGTVAVSALVIR